jgi:hypothetical protein
MPKYNYDIKLSQLPTFMKKIVKWAKNTEIIEIKINGEYYNIVDDIGATK